MPFSYPIGSLVGSAAFVGTGQGANTEVSLGDLGVITEYFLSEGTIVQFEVGIRANVVNDPTARTLRFGMRMGGLGGAVLLNTGPLALPTSTAVVNSPMTLRGHLTQRTVGVSGTASVTGTMPNRVFANAIDKAHPFTLPWIASTYDTTIEQVVTFSVGESVNTVADQVELESALLIAHKI